jgi:hypothetical protein
LVVDRSDYGDSAFNLMTDLRPAKACPIGQELTPSHFYHDGYSVNRAIGGGVSMRRKSRGPKDTSGSFNVMRDINPEKLKTFAAIIIVWNYVETFLDAALGYAMKIDSDLFPHVSSRINGLDGKIAILKEAITLSKATDARPTLNKTFNAVESYKKLRDGIVHVKIPSPTADVADTIQRRGIRDEILISQTALTSLYDRLCIVCLEMNYVFLFMHYSAMAESFGPR